MSLPPFDIFKKDFRGNPIWLDAVTPGGRATSFKPTSFGYSWRIFCVRSKEEADHCQFERGRQLIFRGGNNEERFRVTNSSAL